MTLPSLLPYYCLEASHKFPHTTGEEIIQGCQSLFIVEFYLGQKLYHFCKEEPTSPDLRTKRNNSMYYCYGLNCSPQNSHVEVLTPSTSECSYICGDTVFKDVIKLK